MKISDALTRFQRQVCWNRYMANELQLWQCGVCTVCYRRLGCRRVVIHHMDYAHQCSWDVSITAQVNKRQVAVPDCRSCHAHSAERFTACRRRLQILHRRCHYEFHHGAAFIRPFA